MGPLAATLLEDEVVPGSGGCPPPLHPISLCCPAMFELVEPNKNNVTGVCAVLFDENCCKASDTFHSIRVGEKGKLCSTGSSLNPFSSCQGPRLDNDVESMIVMPGCKLEVWDDEDGVKDAEDEERKGFNQGNIKDTKDRYDQEKLVLEARNSPHWIEEMNDDFDDMNEDISSYRCTC